jgi:hypothetical protein
MLKLRKAQDSLSPKKVWKPGHFEYETGLLTTAPSNVACVGRVRRGSTCCAMLRGSIEGTARTLKRGRH